MSWLLAELLIVIYCYLVEDKSYQLNKTDVYQLDENKIDQLDEYKKTRARRTTGEQVKRLQTSWLSTVNYVGLYIWFYIYSRELTCL